MQQFQTSITKKKMTNFNNFFVQVPLKNCFITIRPSLLIKHKLKNISIYQRCFMSQM